MQAEYESDAAAELHNVAASSTENPTTDEKEEVVPEEPIESVLKDEEQVCTGNSTSEETSAPTQLTCLTVQPNRVLCGVRLKELFISNIKNNISRAISKVMPCVTRVVFNMNSHFWKSEWKSAEIFLHSILFLLLKHIGL